MRQYAESLKRHTEWHLVLFNMQNRNKLMSVVESMKKILRVITI